MPATNTRARKANMITKHSLSSFAAALDCTTIEALHRAHSLGYMICSYSDAISEGAEDITPERASAIAAEDAGLIYLQGRPGVRHATISRR